jgi:CheY-like chemotaxis protein
MSYSSLRTVRTISLENPVQYVRNGEDAMAYLRGVGRFANRAEYPVPVLILLDLKLPDVDGFAVLSWIRQQQGFRDLPVVVLSASSEIPIINQAYRLGANSFLVKATDFEKAVEQSRLFLSYWLQKARKPNASRPPPRKPPSER